MLLPKSAQRRDHTYTIAKSYKVGVGFKLLPTVSGVGSVLRRRLFVAMTVSGLFVAGESPDNGDANRISPFIPAAYVQQLCILYTAGL